jgi:DNA polymerase-3 subunit delta'
MLFKDIPGLQNEKHKLLESVHRNQNGHAQLFHGLPGTASYSLALAYAQYLACLNPQKEDSCAICTPCKQFAKLSYPDLHLSFPFARIAGAPRELNCEYFQKDWMSFLAINKIFNLNDWLNKLDIANKQAQINVDEASRLIKKLSLKSYSGGPKIVLLYLPEYLHPSAANKLLKTLEEPTDKSVIILISENPEKLLQTITSRCQKLYIPRPSAANIIDHLISEGATQESAKTAAIASEGDLVLAKKIAIDSDKYLVFGQLFQNWMRACYGAKAKDIFTFVDEFSALDRESQKEGLKFFMQTLQIAFGASRKKEKANHPIYEKLAFKLDGFASILHPENALLALEVLDNAIYDISRNGNVKIILSDASFKFSNLLRLKEKH